MVFSSLKFIFVFLPLVLAAYFLVLRLCTGRRALFTVLNLVLLVASVIFYTEGERKFAWVMLLIGLIDYVLARLIERDRVQFGARTHKQKVFLTISVLSNMGLLFYFKYIHFAADILAKVIVSVPHTETLHRLAAVSLPIGISFYTFESMSYIIDVYRGEVTATRRFIDYWTFITFFPHLVAGPIIRYADLKAQLENRRHNWEQVNIGLKRFSLGLAKKVIVANPLGYYADMFFSLDATRIDTALAWVAIASYALQIYFDFSGYSDMAIGLAKIFGITLPENFNYPYIAQSMKDFWRRWHMTLSQWFRDYLYIPAGGSRRGVIIEYRNLFTVFVLCGLWHGASFNFLAWGCFHGAFLVLERLAGAAISFRPPRWLKHTYAVFVILLSWVWFRVDTLEQAVNFYRALFFGNSRAISADTLTLLQRPHFYMYFVLGLVFCTPISRRLDNRLARAVSSLSSPILTLWSQGIPALLLVVATIFLSGQEYNPFIYFRF